MNEFLKSSRMICLARFHRSASGQPRLRSAIGCFSLGLLPLAAGAQTGPPGTPPITPPTGPPTISTPSAGPLPTTLTPLPSMAPPPSPTPLAAPYTNAPAIAYTNALPGPIISQWLGTNYSGTPRMVTLDGLIQEALQHNFDVKIQRAAPEIARLNLAADYGIFEPSFTFNYLHSYNSSPGGFTTEGIRLPSNEVESDNLSYSVGPGLSGYMPTGTRYQLSDYLNETLIYPRNPQDVYTSGPTISLDQPLLRNFWIDQGRATLWADKQTLKMSEYAFEQQVMQTVVNVESAYYSLIFSRENVRVQQKALEYMDRLLEENRTRVRIGAMAPLDEQYAESQVASTRALLLDAQRAVLAQENVLKNLITDNYLQWHDLRLIPGENLLSIPANFDLQESWREGLALRPDFLQAKLAVEKQNITIRYDKNQLFPGLDLVGSYGGNALETSYSSAFQNAFYGANPRYTAGVVLSIPMGNTTARYRLKAARKQKEQLVLQLQQLQQSILVAIDNAVKLAQSDFDRITATREARAYAEAALDAEEKKLENGKSTSFLVLQYQRDLTAARYNEIQALAQYNIDLAQLAFQEGATLQRRHLTLRFD